MPRSTLPPAPLRAAAAPLLLACVLAACGGDAAASAGPVTRDSAGIRIVENAAPAWGDGEGWTVSAEPSLDIGMVEGAAEYQLDRVRGVLRMADGRIAVANGNPQEIRLFDAEGRHLRTLGREGGGPGEFRQLFWIGARADSLLAWDGNLKRLTVFAPDGSVARVVTPAGLDLMFPQMVGMLTDGSLVTTGGMNFTFSANGSGERRDTVHYPRFGPDGSALGEVGRYPGPEWFVMTEGDILMTNQVLFGRDVKVRTAGNEVLVADDDRFELRFFAPDGTPRRIVRRAHQPVRVTGEHVDAHFAESEKNIDQMPSEMRATSRRMVERQRRELPRRGTFPAFGSLLIDTENNVWVQEYPAPGAETHRWSVFDPRGAWLGTVEVPARIRILQIGADWIAGVESDELDVQHVRVYPLHKPSRAD